MRTRITLPALSIFILFISYCHAQQPDQDTAQTLYPPYVEMQQQISVLTGYNFWSNHYAELGIVHNQHGRAGTHLSAWAYFFSTEIRSGKELIIGPKAGAWISGGSSALAIGINMVCYTDFEEYSLRIRPELGIGFGIWKVVYGYNIPITNKDFEGINRSNIGIALLFDIRKLKEI